MGCFTEVEPMKETNQYPVCWHTHNGTGFEFWIHPFCHLAADLNESSWPWKSARCIRIILLGLAEKSNRVYKSTSWFKSHYGINLYVQCSWIGFNLKDTDYHGM